MGVELKRQLKGQLSRRPSTMLYQSHENFQLSQSEILKARSGIYKDTPQNRKLGVVGKRYGQEKDLDTFYNKQIGLHTSYADFVTRLASELNGEVIVAPPKNLERLREKVSFEYKGDFKKVKDVLRSTIVVDRDRVSEATQGILDRLSKSNKSNFLVKAHVDFESDGYQGANFVSEFEGFAVEIQLNTPVNIALKESGQNLQDHPALKNTYEMLKESGIEPGMGHKYYEKFRSPSSTEKESLEAELQMIEYYKNRYLFTNKDVVKKSFLSKVRDLFSTPTVFVDESGTQLSDVDMSRHKLRLAKGYVDYLIEQRTELSEEFEKAIELQDSLEKANPSLKDRLQATKQAREDLFLKNLLDNTSQIDNASDDFLKALEEHIELVRQGEFAYKRYLNTSLGRTRDSMPQIDSDKLDDVILHFAQRSPDSKVTKEKLNIKDLQFAQGEINEEKVLNLLSDYPITNHTYLVAKNKGQYTLIDGHHRLCALCEINPEQEITAYVIHLDPVEAMRRLNLMKLTRNEDINKATEEKPHYAAAIVFNDKNQILFLRRHPQDDFHPNTLCLPSGSLEPNEEPDDAAMRELLEETNLQTLNISHAAQVNAPDAKINYHYIIVDPNEPIVLDKEHSNYEWWSMKELAQNDQVRESLILDLYEHLESILTDTRFEKAIQDFSLLQKAFNADLLSLQDYLDAKGAYEQISKAGGHKYIRKTPDGKGGWNYIYENPKGNKHFEDYSNESNSDLKTLYLEEAKKVEKYLDNNENIKQSLNLYLGEGYRDFRMLLTEKDSFLKEESSEKVKSYEICVREISKFINDNKIDKDLSLHRRVGIGAAKTFFNSLKEGDVYEDKSFSSSSLRGLSKFGNFNIKILAKRGSNVANVNNENEFEYLIDKGSKFRVLDTHNEELEDGSVVKTGITVQLI